MKKFNKNQIKIIEKEFTCYEDDEILQLEKWTNGGVDMVIYINKSEDSDYLQQLKNYVENFDIDEEIEVHRQNYEYRRDFTITESIKDFMDFVDDLKNIITTLEN